jgi:antitoxin YefM
MTTMTVSEARANLSRLLDEVVKSHKPAIITGKRSNGIMISEEDWNSIQETLHLMSMPGMCESIRDGLETPIESCSGELHW